MLPDAPNLPKFELSSRVCCITCGKPLVAFQGQFFHIEEPCAGLLDYIEIEAIISDEFLHEKFEKLYGKPEIDDYKRLELLEVQLLKHQEKILSLEKSLGDSLYLLDKPLIKFLAKFFKGKNGI